MAKKFKRKLIMLAYIPSAKSRYLLQYHIWIAFSLYLAFHLLMSLSQLQMRRVLFNMDIAFSTTVYQDGFEFLAQASKIRFYKGSFISVFVTSCRHIDKRSITTTYAYAISRSTFKYRKFFTIFALLSMLFNAGLIPYIV